MIKKLLLIIVLLSAGAFYASYSVTQNPNQKLFVKGTLPKESMDGFYKGTEGIKTPWAGKNFEAKTSSGINVFEQNGIKIEKVRFKTYKGKGIQDKNVDVLKIDYDVKGAPFFLKPLLDEIVQVDKNKYLGKIHMRIIPNFPFTIGYFWLEK